MFSHCESQSGRARSRPPGQFLSRSLGQQTVAHAEACMPLLLSRHEVALNLAVHPQAHLIMNGFHAPHGDETLGFSLGSVLWAFLLRILFVVLGRQPLSDREYWVIRLVPLEDIKHRNLNNPALFSPAAKTSPSSAGLKTPETAENFAPTWSKNIPKNKPNFCWKWQKTLAKLFSTTAQDRRILKTPRRKQTLLCTLFTGAVRTTKKS